jgi:hypothetical protein
MWFLRCRRLHAQYLEQTSSGQCVVQHQVGDASGMIASVRPVISYAHCGVFVGEFLVTCRHALYAHTMINASMLLPTYAV